MYGFLTATFAMAEYRLGDISGRDVDLFAGINIGDAAFGHGIVDRLFDLLFETADKALAIDSALVFSV